MIVVLILGVLAMFFAWLEGIGQYKHGLKISFGLIFIFLALRYNYGSDYPSYLIFFNELKINSIIDIYIEKWKIEPGWILLNWICKPIGFFGMTAILAAFNCYIYYKFTKKYVPSNYYWFSIFLFVFEGSYMLVNLSAMRQSVAIAFFVLSIDYLYNKGTLRYIACILIASLFHLSALILLPIYILGLINFKINFKLGFLLISSYIFLFAYADKIFPDIQSFTNKYFFKYSLYENSQTLKAGYGILFNSLVFILIVIYSKFQDDRNSILFKIGIVGFFIIPIILFIQSFSRLGLYFQPTLLAVYPIIISQIKNLTFKYFLLFILMIYTIYTFDVFFESPIWIQSFTDYKTIFSAPAWF